MTAVPFDVGAEIVGIIGTPPVVTGKVLEGEIMTVGNGTLPESVVVWLGSCIGGIKIPVREVVLFVVEDGNFAIGEPSSPPHPDTSKTTANPAKTKYRTTDRLN